MESVRWHKLGMPSRVQRTECYEDAVKQGCLALDCAFVPAPDWRFKCDN
jgi:hypothetical protein